MFIKLFEFEGQLLYPHHVENVRFFYIVSPSYVGQTGTHMQEYEILIDWLIEEKQS